MVKDAVSDARCMTLAIEAARRGEGFVEPNPMVGCVIVRDGELLATGYHRAFGSPHAERDAISAATKSGVSLHGTTFYVTLEPCCHHGKTPPCTDAIIAAAPRRVVVAVLDPFASVSGRGVAALREAGIDVAVGTEEAAARDLLAPYLTRILHHRPWIIAKYAMTLDGKIASVTGSSRWISGEASREHVMQLRRRVDAIIVGGNTARNDNPLLTVRTNRVDQCSRPHAKPLRVVLSRSVSLSRTSQLAQTTVDAPVLLAVSPREPLSPEETLHAETLCAAGTEIVVLTGETEPERLRELLSLLAARDVTNLLVEGGGEILGAFFDLDLIDEVYAFIAPKLIGGASAPTPIAGVGRETINLATHLTSLVYQVSGEDILLHGRIVRQPYAI